MTNRQHLHAGDGPQFLRSRQGHDGLIETQACGLRQAPLDTDCGPDLSGQADLPEGDQPAGVGRLRAALTTASATARSVAGSTARAPPTVET